MRKHIDRYFIRYSFWAVLGLIGLSWGYILKDQPTALSELFRAENWDYLTEFLAGMAGVG
ncbi:ABC transporter permease, partial [Glaesserella parasuis]|nr:ABC transporter permease [Glaesserella parasuis]